MLDFRIKERAFEEPTGIKRIYSSIVSGNQAIMTKIGPAVASRVNMKNKLIKMDKKAKRWNFDMCDTVATSTGATSTELEPTKTSKIGRASCRERV